ncbi:MAG: hypothetical protein CBARDCOR_3917 [uncultured Caballeronia sp.]|nr:MAG: hypothetical protein CBARDCOR_3917 [uncultured Caballeronia sp.]
MPMPSSLPVTFSRPPPQLSARPTDAIPDADSAPAVALLADTLREAAARGVSRYPRGTGRTRVAHPVVY